MTLSSADKITWIPRYLYSAHSLKNKAVSVIDSICYLSQQKNQEKYVLLSYNPLIQLFLPENDRRQVKIPKIRDISRSCNDCRFFLSLQVPSGKKINVFGFKLIIVKIYRNLSESKII